MFLPIAKKIRLGLARLSRGPAGFKPVGRSDLSFLRLVAAVSILVLSVLFLCVPATSIAQPLEEWYGHRIAGNLGHYELQVESTFNQGGCRPDFGLSKGEIKKYLDSACVVNPLSFKSYYPRPCWVESKVFSQALGALKLTVNEGGTAVLQLTSGGYIYLVCDEPCKDMFEMIGPESVTAEELALAGEPLRFSTGCLKLRIGFKGGKYREPQEVGLFSQLLDGALTVRISDKKTGDSRFDCEDFFQSAEESLRLQLPTAKALSPLDARPSTAPCWVVGTVHGAKGEYKFRFIKGGVVEIWKDQVMWMEFAMVAERTIVPRPR